MPETRRPTTRHRPVRPATRPSSTSCARPSPGRGGEIQLTDALLTWPSTARPTAARARRRLLRAAATTPGTARLPAHRGAARLRAIRPGRDRALAAQVPGQPLGGRCPRRRRSISTWPRSSRTTPLAPTELGLGDIGGLVLAEDVSAARAAVVRQLHGRLRGAGRGRHAVTEAGAVTLPGGKARRSSGGDTRRAAQPGTPSTSRPATLPHGAEAVVPVELDRRRQRRRPSAPGRARQPDPARRRGRKGGPGAGRRGHRRCRCTSR